MDLTLKKALENLKKNEPEHTKRYLLICQEWGVTIHGTPWIKESRYEGDTLEELKPDIKFIEEIYSDVLRPDEPVTSCLEGKSRGYRTKTARTTIGLRSTEDNIYDKNYVYDKNRYWWGYLILDYKENLPVKTGGVGILTMKYPHVKANLVFMDNAFRKPGEVPENYVWDSGEYEGWLIYRWGNGKNAVEKQHKPKSKFAKPMEDDSIELEEDLIYEEIENDFDKKIKKGRD